MNDVIPLPSPNFDSRDGQAVDMLVMHYTGMKDGVRALERLTDAKSQVSAHYVVDELGGVFSLVDEQMRAWHAGKAYWRGHTNINQRSIGIEIINPGHEFGCRPFPKVQMQAVIALSKGILSRHDIPAHNVIGHSDVAPTRKQDPGELFDWAWLAKEGIGFFISPPASSTDCAPVSSEENGRSQQAELAASCETTHNIINSNEVSCPSGQQASAGQLKAYGYDTTSLPAAITAFQRHFRPSLLNGQWDAECGIIIESLLGKA